MSKVRNGMLAGLVVLILLAFAVEVQAMDGNHGEWGNSSLTGTFSFRLVPVMGFPMGPPRYTMMPPQDFTTGTGTIPPGTGTGTGTMPTPPTIPPGPPMPPTMPVMVFEDILRVGVFTADGESNIHGRTLATTGSGLIDFTWTGTYHINSDGTGMVMINDPQLSEQFCLDMATSMSVFEPCSIDREGAEAYAIVVNRHDGDDKTVDLIQAAGGGRLFTGQASRM